MLQGALEDAAEFENKSSWDVAIRYQDLKRLGHISDKEKQKLKKRAVAEILRKAHALLGAVIKPEKNVLLNYQEFMNQGARGELDIEETYSQNVLNPAQADLKFNSKVEKEFDLVIIMDSSLSMTGEKIALLALSTAIVALCVKSHNLTLLGFDSKTKWVKVFNNNFTVENIIERVLELPTGGFTNIELALNEVLKKMQSLNKNNSNVILISDGKYTEGNDPLYLAKRFKHLSILKIGKDQAGRDLLLDLADQGNGKFFEAKKFNELPKTMYNALKTLLR